MLSPAQIAANRRSLSDLLRVQMNLPALASEWSYAQRVEYNRAFAAYVLAHPGSFGGEEVATAQIVAGEHPSALTETSISGNVAAFGANLLDNAVAAADDVGGIGRGALTTARIAAWVIPGGLLILAGIYLYGAYKKQTR